MNGVALAVAIVVALASAEALGDVGSTAHDAVVDCASVGVRSGTPVGLIASVVVMRATVAVEFAVIAVAVVVGSSLADQRVDNPAFFVVTVPCATVVWVLDNADRRTF